MSQERSRIPLSPSDWFDRIRMIDARLTKGEVSLESALRHSFHLLLIAPGPLAEVFRVKVSEAQFEAWLDDDAYDQAAQGLISHHFPLVLSVPDGKSSVTIEAPWFDAKGEVVAKDSSEAVLRAWFSCLLDLQAKASEEFFNRPGQALHGHQFAQHRPSTRH